MGLNNYGISCGGGAASVNVRVVNQYTKIPDSVFADALTRLGYAVTNGQMLSSDALSIKRLCITSLQDFYGTADANGVSTFNNSSVPDNGVRCAYTPTGSYIASVDGLESMLNLQSFRIEMQKFSALDISNLNNLTFMSLYGNPFSTIDLSANSALQFLGLGETSLTAVDFSALTNIVEIAVQNDATRTLPYTSSSGTLVKGFSSLDISKNKTLRRLYAQGNGLTTLNFNAVNNVALQELWINNNNIQALDLSDLSALDYVIVNNNNLTNFNLKGVARGGIPSRFYADHNPNLNTILVTNPVAWRNAADATQSAFNSGQASPSPVVSVDSQTQFVNAP